MAISEIQLYKALRLKLGEKETEELVSFVKKNIETEINIKSDSLSSKEDISRLELKIAETKVDIIKWVFAMFFALAIMIIGLYFKN